MNSVAERRLDLDLSRRSTDRVVAGVAGGVADQLGVQAGYVRAAFVVAAFLWGLGIVVYVALWMATFERVDDRPRHLVATHQQAGLGLVFLGALIAFRAVGWWPGDLVIVIVSTLAFGTAVLSDFDWLGRILDPEAVRPSRQRIVVGTLLLLVGLGVLAGAASQLSGPGWAPWGSVATAVVLTLAGVFMVFGPWLVGMGRALTTERRERIRQEERAEMAAHLHDSVLQTLALMQRADDPKRIVTLARQQERELRTWLYGGEAPANGHRLTSALEDLAARVEGDFTVPVEVVTVGDARLDEPVRAAVAAAGEAIVNAAKHSGADEVSVYAEVGDGRVDVWVADLGEGFDPDAVPPHRRGIADSIQARMARVGGGAAIETHKGEGTEVHVWAPLAPPQGNDR